jgi:UDP-glucose 4-epimerase
MTDQSSEPRTVLVTGGAGFIGTIVSRQLVERGWHVRILDNFYRADLERMAELERHERVQVIEGDVRYRSSLDKAMAGVDACAHLAAVCINKSVADPTESLDTNLMGTQHAIESAIAAGVPRLVFASSASVYGDPVSLPMKETDAPSPQTPYCMAKYTGEQLLRFAARKAPLSWLALRFFNVYGPGQQTDAYYTSVVLTFLRRIAAGHAPVIDGDGSQSMDFVHVEDIGRSVVMSVESDATGHVLNVGSQSQTTIAELAKILIRHMGVDIEPQFRPRDVLVNRREADISLIRSVLGWEPTIPVDDGLATVVEHLKMAGHLD